MSRIRFLKGDITKLETEAIVNAANSSLLGGGGVDGAIHRAAGPQLLKECQTLGGCLTGKVKMTKGYRLPAKFVIHAVGPVWHDGKNGEPGLLQNCYKNSLQLAADHRLKSIAFPAISTGIYGYPFDAAEKIALTTVREFLQNNPFPSEVIFVFFSDKDYDRFKVLYEENSEI